MIARRSFVGALAAVHWVAPCRVGAQPAGRIHRLGLLHPGTPMDSDDLNAPTFLTTPLRDLGYVERNRVDIAHAPAQTPSPRRHCFGRLCQGTQRRAAL